jgi:hypothetical protein
MEEYVKTAEMEMGPVRVPVMMEKNVANRLAAYILTRGRADYDTAMQRIIEAGLEATRRQDPSREP